MRFKRCLLACLCVWPMLLSAANAIYAPVLVTPPDPVREFRGAWLATVAQIDWPSKPGLPAMAQRAELAALLDRAVQLKLNAIIFQVRPAADALYESSLEPWSEYLTGRMGQAPEPAYDPLAFAVAEAHRRGLQLHAWFNPFRARHSQAKSPVAPLHISQTHPEMVRKYGDELDLDPGDPAVQAHVLRVILDVVNRYDVDGVQFDDYFYPYPAKDSLKREVDFPDLATWQKYGAPAHLDRADWRRQNINLFVHNVHQAIKTAKPWVQFGISPFGIWRPGYPPSVHGFDPYAKIYADSRLWLAKGWVDYLAPQLYWPNSAPEQGFGTLLRWWEAQNTLHRHVWPGLADYRIGQTFANDEITRQINITRSEPAPGTIHFHMRNLMTNNNFTASLRLVYDKPALPPTSPWLDAAPPAEPDLWAKPLATGAQAVWRPGNGVGKAKPVRNWVLQARYREGWRTEILPAQITAWNFNGPPPEIVVVRAADRLGNLSGPAAVIHSRPPTPPPAGHRPQ